MRRASGLVEGIRRAYSIGGRIQDTRRIHRGGGEHRLGDRTARDQGVERAPDEPGVDVAGPELRVRDQPRQERHVGRDPGDLDRPERAGEAIERRGAVGAVRDDLGEHRIVVRGDGIALAYAVVDAQIPGRRWEREMRDGAGGGEESALGVFGVDPRLDRVPGDRTVPPARSAAARPPRPGVAIPRGPRR